MDVFQETSDAHKKTFFSHVFSTTEEGKAEILNVVQYSVMGVIPIVILNKLIQRFIPEADTDKSSLELLAEIFIQLIIMFCGIIVIHRAITFVPSYSGFKYENLTLTNVILAFLVLVLSIQTKLGIKVNIMVDRLFDLWEGSSSSSDKKSSGRKGARSSDSAPSHSPSQADYLDNSQVQNTVFPPAPVATTRQSTDTYDTMMRGGNDYGGMAAGPMAANGVLGGGFGSFF